MNLYKTYISLLIIFVLFVAATLIFNPSYADFLFKEDGIVEISGIAVSGAALVLSLVLSLRGYRRREVWRFWLFLAFLSFLFIGESLSWGERIFNLKMPVIAGIKFDAIHDVLSVSIGVMKKTRDFIIEAGLLDLRSIAVISSSVIIFGLLLYFMAKTIVKQRRRIIQFFKPNLKKAPFLFVFLALILILAAMIIDDDNLVQFPHKEVVDEGLELLAVSAFLFSCICGFLEKKWGFANKRIL